MIVNGKNVRVSFNYKTGRHDPETHIPIQASGEGVLLGAIYCGTNYRAEILSDDLSLHKPRDGEYQVIGLGDLKPTNT